MAEAEMQSETPLPPTTTSQEDLTHAGQRRINLIWERTQAIIAIAVTVTALAVVGCAAFIPVTGPIAVAAIVFVTNLASLVINSYFQRTNHTRIGGVDPRRDFGR
jgi:hypothetical protein